MAVITQPVIDWTNATKPSSQAAVIAAQNVPSKIVHGPQAVIPAPLSTQLAPDPAVGYPTSG